jgi:23S rRNA (guanosine2251-2'-O)-methyltransferase
MIYLTGFHAIEERIKSGRSCGPLLVAKPGPRARSLSVLANEKKIRTERGGTAALDHLAPLHRGIALAVDEGGFSSETSLEEFLEGIENSGKKGDILVIILDEITDPHNYGAI